MRKKSNKEKDSSQSNFLNDKVMHFFHTSRAGSFSAKEVMKKLGWKGKETKQTVDNVLRTLADEGKLIPVRGGMYKLDNKKEVEFFTGTVDHVNPRFCFVGLEDGITEVKIQIEDMKDAIDGDKVQVVVFPQKAIKNDNKLRGKVVEIIERKRKEFVGKIEITDRFAFVIPDNRKIFFDIYIPKENINKARHGQKVICKITEWRKGNMKNPIGKVTDVLGDAGDNNTEMHAILAEFGLPYRFEKDVERDAAEIPGVIDEKEIARRRDFRNITTFTIDPYDAKDFDDALSIQKLENGNWEIGVHIADVTHYVREGTALEEEAYNRATSVYLVDRVVPMLPERLSNDLCSLRPKEDKLTFSAVFEIDKEAKVKKEWFGKTIIHSDRRFTYEEVQEMLEGKEGDFKEECTTLNDLALKLRKDRFKKGAISFETIEIKFKLDEKGKPLGVYPKVRKDAHKLIEEFMLLANKKVAEFVYSQKIADSEDRKTMVYRIHDNPNPEKLKSLATFAGKFGHKLNVFDEVNIAKTLNQLTEDVEGKPEQNVLQGLAIRCMAKAIYTTEAEIHFGLAFKNYTHFTSPIRRYPDMMVHRLLHRYLNKKDTADKREFEEKCKHSSEMEKLAADAERASIKYKQVEYMMSFPQKEFEGIISGMNEYGFYVEIVETKCEGMVRLSDLTDDFYEVDFDSYRIIGKRTKKLLTLGDKVMVKVKKTDLAKRTIDLEWIKE